MELEKNDIIECAVDTLGIYGEGIAHVEGKTVFIKGALPGEKVRAKIIFNRPSFCDARLESVLYPSPDRVPVDCPVFGKCGGCALRHLSRDAELVYKRERLRETFKKVAGLDVEPEQTVACGDRTRCRNKLSLPIRETDGKLQIGFFAANSHRVVEINDCLLQPAWNRALIGFIRQFMAETGLRGYDEQAGVGDLRHLVAREISGRIYVMPVVLDASKAVYKRLPSALPAALSREVAVWLNENRKPGNRILGDKFLQLSALPPVEVSGVTVDVHPAGFFQVNDAVRDRLYADVTAEIDGGTVIDAYAGAGLMTAILAKKCDTVYGVELDKAAMASAEQTVRRNGIDNMKMIAGDCAEVLPRLVTGKESAIVLDPPRAGCDARVLAAAAKIPKILYVSCNPATLARDARMLTDAGYTIAFTRPYDMFPGTVSMESLTVFIK